MVYPNFCLESRRPKAWGCDIGSLEGSFHMCSGKHDVHLDLRGGSDSKMGIYLYQDFRCMDDIEIEILNS